MNIKVIKENILNVKADICVFGAFSGSAVWDRTLHLGRGRELREADKILDGAIKDEAESALFTGGLGEILIVNAKGKLGAKFIFVVGLGEARAFNAETLRRAAAFALKAAKKRKAGSLAVDLNSMSDGKIAPYFAARAFAEGALLSNYEFSKYKEKKTKAQSRELGEIIFLERDSTDAKAAQKGIEAAQISAAAAIYARDLVNEPASVCVPSHLAEHAKQIVKASKGKIKVRIFGRDEARKRGMGAFLAVAAGAGEEPYFIHLSYKPTANSRQLKKIVLVGKGITFDSGGLQIKPGESMATMKLDMAGAAAVLGVFSRIAEFAPKAEVHGIIAATENMPGPSAYKPGDIVRAMNGKTIEIGHTDAEGRVTLADSLSFAAKLKPHIIIDLATLTGACMVALGEEVCGLMSNNRKLADKIKASAEVSGEKMWELPLVPEYKQLIKGTHGDVKNSGGTRYGGAITAGLFLEEFVGGTSWAHLDIAGPAWAEREGIPYMPLGGTGYGARTLIEFLKNI